MPYLFFGKTSLCRGKPLFKLLCKLKDHGQGRIVCSTLEMDDFPGEISFYRVLLAQPLMDKDTLHGRVVAERVFKGRRYKEPVVLSSVAHKPDFLLIPKADEESFCQWDSILDYDKARDAPHMSKYIDMPPLLKEVVRRNRLARGESMREENFLLPAYKIYRGDFNIKEDETRPHHLRQYVDERHRTYEDFNQTSIPREWIMERLNLPVGRRRWEGFLEETREWPKQQAREDRWQKVREAEELLRGSEC